MSNFFAIFIWFLAKFNHFYKKDQTLLLCKPKQKISAILDDRLF